MKLDNYFNIYHKKMDADVPDTQKMWEHIAQEVGSKKRTIHLTYMRIAVSILILAGIGLAIAYQLPALIEKRSVLAACSKPAFAKELAYKKTLEQKRKEIIPHLPNQEVQIISFLKKEYQYYEKEYAESIKQLQKNNCNNFSINIIYKTYERRIAILDDMKHESEKFKNYASNNP